MKSFFSFFAFLSLFLFTVTIGAARKDAGKYWRAAVKDQRMTEALEQLVQIEAASAGSDEKTKCHTPATIELMEEKIVIEDLDRPIKPRGHVKKSTFADDFEPRPNVSAYGNDANLKGKKTSSFSQDFEPRPNVSAYGDDANLKGKKSIAEDFEPRPNISAYGGGDDGAVHIREGISFTSDFEPEPTATSYYN